jgi:S1/P1 Nuclease
MAIAKDFAVLTNKTAPQDQRAQSLKFLGHWVGDVHQPLHVSFEDDRGGNEIRVSGECSGKNLHSVWDACLVQAAVGDNVRDAATALVSSIKPAQAQMWKQSGPKQWANESFEITESVQTKYCEMHGNSCDQPSGTVRIDQAYIDRNVPIVKEQLQKAGVRLADLLDRARWATKENHCRMGPEGDAYLSLSLRKPHRSRAGEA